MIGSIGKEQRYRNCLEVCMLSLNNDALEFKIFIIGFVELHVEKENLFRSKATEFHSLFPRGNILRSNLGDVTLIFMPIYT